MLFQGQQLDLDKLWQNISFMLWSWLLAYHDNFVIPFQQWQVNSGAACQISTRHLCWKPVLFSLILVESIYFLIQDLVVYDKILSLVVLVSTTRSGQVGFCVMVLF